LFPNKLLSFLPRLIKEAAMKAPLLLVVVGSVLLAGCAHKLDYKLTEKDRWAGPKISGALYVKPFVDQTVAIIDKEERIDGKKWRTNYRKGYSDTNLSATVTAMITKHIAYSGLFSEGICGSDKNADWILSGKLTEFNAHAQVNEKAENIQAVSAGFGLLGALVGGATTSKMTSDIKTRVELDDISLNDNAGKAIWLNSIVITNSVAANFNAASQYAVFNYPDENLKEAVTEMIQRIGNSVTNQAHAPLR
jgi:hypothetical protein